MERYLGTFKALRYHELVTPARVRTYLVFAVAYPSALVFPLAYTQYIDNRNPLLPCYYPLVFRPWVIHLVAAHVELSVIALFTIYIAILDQAYRQKRRTASMNGERQRASSESSLKGLPVIRQFALIISVFTSTLMPYYIMSHFIAEEPVRYMTNPVASNIFQVMVICLISNNIINPIIYALKFKNYRNAFTISFGFRVIE